MDPGTEPCGTENQLTSFEVKPKSEIISFGHQTILRQVFEFHFYQFLFLKIEKGETPPRDFPLIQS